MSGAERRRLLVDWNATTAEFPRDRVPPRAVRAPRPGGPPTGRRRGRRRRAELRRAGPPLPTGSPSGCAAGRRPGRPVGLACERSADLVVGDPRRCSRRAAAYVPLDPAYPPAGWPGCSTDCRPRSSWPRRPGRPASADGSAASCSRRPGRAGGPGHRGAIRARPPTTWPTSSTRPARPGEPKGVAVPAPGRRPAGRVGTRLSSRRRPPGRPAARPDRLRRLDLRALGRRCCTARRCVVCRRGAVLDPRAARADHPRPPGDVPRLTAALFNAVIDQRPVGAAGAAPAC